MKAGTTSTRQDNLHRLFAPESVAVVGASASTGKVGHQAMLALADFPGEVFAINPKSTDILGRKAYASLHDLGRPVDLVLLALPAAPCVEAVRQAVAENCGAGLILSSGFAESGPEGEALQNELQELCAQSNFRILGPNTAGFVNRSASLTASFVANASQIPGGNVAVVAQSAGVNFTVSFLLEQLGAGVSVAVGLGNSIDVNAADVVEFLAGHDGTRAIALHLEGVPMGRRLYDVIRRVTVDKPVVALTVGKDEVGEFARSHTGNLIGSYEVRRNALLQAGAVVVETTEELAAAAVVLSNHRLPPKPRPGVGLLTAQAGPALLAFDQLKTAGVNVPALAPETVARIAEQLPPLTHLTNPVDTGRPGPSFANVLQILAGDDGIDLVAAYALHEPAALLPTEVLPAIARRFTKPILFGTQGPGAEVNATARALRGQGMCVATSPEQLARAAMVLTQDASQQARLLHVPVARRPIHVDIPQSSDEKSVKDLLAALGVDVPRGIGVTSHEDAFAAFSALTKPIVVKILAEEVAHKTEVGGVYMNVRSEADLDLALAQLDAVPLSSQRRYLLEETAPPGLEVIIGGLRDPSFGPTVTVGLGGVLAEALKDTATRLAPITEADATTMLDELRSAQLFDGWRGSPALDRQALTQTIVLVAQLLFEHPVITELEINPLRVYPRGVMALDATINRA